MICDCNLDRRGGGPYHEASNAYKGVEDCYVLPVCAKPAYASNKLIYKAVTAIKAHRIILNGDGRVSRI